MDDWKDTVITLAVAFIAFAMGVGILIGVLVAVTE